MIPDKDQVREALDLFDGRELERPEEAELMQAIFDVAWAFVEGDLIPAEVDYEAAAIAEYENRGYLAETWMDNDSWMPYVENTRAAAKRVVDAALAFQETPK